MPQREACYYPYLQCYKKFYLEREEAMKERASNLFQKKLPSFATEHGEVQA